MRFTSLQILPYACKSLWHYFTFILLNKCSVHVSCCSHITVAHFVLNTMQSALIHLQVYIYIYIYISGGPLSALTCCVNVRLLLGDKKNIAVNLFSKLGWELGLYYASYDDFHPDILARMYT